MTETQKTFLKDLLHVIGKEGKDHEVYRAMGWPQQKWNFYKNVSPNSFPMTSLFKLQQASGLGRNKFWDLLKKHFSPK